MRVLLCALLLAIACARTPERVAVEGELTLLTPAIYPRWLVTCDARKRFFLAFPAELAEDAIARIREAEALGKGVMISVHGQRLPSLEGSNATATLLVEDLDVVRSGRCRDE